MILAHWDTRPTSDQAARFGGPLDSRAGGERRRLRDRGAARAGPVAFAQIAPPLGVDLLFVDGEDYGPGVEDMLLGARHYAETVSDEDRPIYGLLLDMVGDAQPSFPVEQISAQFANPIVQKVWRAAERLGYRDYFPTAVGEPLTDDHVPADRERDSHRQRDRFHLRTRTTATGIHRRIHLTS